MSDLKYQFRAIETWPGKTTKNRKRSRFDSSWSQTLELLERELRHLRARNVVIEADCRPDDIRLDGMFRANSKLRGPGVILSFESQHGPLRYPCDTYDEWQDNVRAIALALEALRSVDRYGVTQRGEQYTGWAKLPPPPGMMITPPSMSVEEAAEVIENLAKERSGLNVLPKSLIEVKRTYKSRYSNAVLATHPDAAPGRSADWLKLQRAKEVLDRHHGV